MAQARGWRVLMAENQLSFIMSSLPPGMSLLEWGAGGSTLWFLDHLLPGQSLVSVEHHAGWSQRVKDETSGDERHRLILAPFPAGKNATSAEEIPAFGENYLWPEVDWSEIGAVLVDGVARGACLAVARQLVRPGVKVFLHDSDRPWYSWAKKLWPEGETIAPEKDDYPRDLWWTTAP